MLDEALLEQIRCADTLDRHTKGSLVLSAREALLQVSTLLGRHQASLVKLPRRTEISVADILRHVADSIDASGSDVVGALPADPHTRQPPLPVGRLVTGPSTASEWVERPRVGSSLLIEETLGDARVALAMPKLWNHKLLLLAHGYREPGLPHLAELDVSSPFVRELLAQGWMVGSTSYSQQGRVVIDALQDVLRLHEWVSRRHGRPEISLLEGRSMGGAVATLAAEGQLGSDGIFDGVVAIGAALLHGVTTDGPPVVFTHRPLVPLLYLTNQSELGAIVRYQREANAAAAPYTPALWEVCREGHNLVSSDERLAAVRGVSSWVEHGTFITGRHRRVFLPGSVEPSPTAAIDRSDPRRPRARAAVLHIDPTFGSVAVAMSPEAMQQLGCRNNKCFAVRIGSRTLHVRYATYPFLFKAGTWFAYDHPEGWLTLTIASAHMFGASVGVEEACGEEQVSSIRDDPAATMTMRARAEAELQVAVGDELAFEALEDQSGQHLGAPRIRRERAAALEAALHGRAALAGC